MCMRRPQAVVNRQSGITLIELIIFMVIMGIAMAGIVSSINFSVMHSADPLVRKQALAIAEALLEEVMLQNFSDPDGPPNVVEASRDLYDDINDYNNYCMATNGCSQSNIVDAAGTAIPNMSGYAAQVVVAPSTLSTITAASGKALRITVTVTGPLNTTVLLEGYRTDYGE
jgi:MSHA pilin protein MshD